MIAVALGALVVLAWTEGATMSLLKRSLKGRYVNVEPFHLFRYCDEQAFRFNERKATDSERFLSAVPSIVGRRLTYKGLTGNVEHN